MSIEIFKKGIVDSLRFWLQQWTFSYVGSSRLKMTLKMCKSDSIRPCCQIIPSLDDSQHAPPSLNFY